MQRAAAITFQSILPAGNKAGNCTLFAEYFVPNVLILIVHTKKK